MMEGGDSEAHSPGLVVTRFFSFSLRSCAVVFVHGGRVLGTHHSCVGVVIVRIVIVVRVVVVVCIVVCGHSCCPCDWFVICGCRIVMHGWWGLFMGGDIIHGWGPDVRGLWLSYMHGVVAVVGH